MFSQKNIAENQGLVRIADGPTVWKSSLHHRILSEVESEKISLEKSLFKLLNQLVWSQSELDPGFYVSFYTLFEQLIGGM